MFLYQIFAGIVIVAVSAVSAVSTVRSAVAGAGRGTEPCTHTATRQPAPTGRVVTAATTA
jgi:hypothetical protein